MSNDPVLPWSAALQCRCCRSRLRASSIRPRLRRSVPPVATIHQNKHFVVRHFRASAHVRVIRSDAPIDSISDAITGLEECRLALASIEPKDYGILFDWRNAPLSTDPDLHKALAARIDELALPFARRAFLVRAGLGTMQVKRIGRTLGSVEMAVVSDEAQALDLVMGHG